MQKTPRRLTTKVAIKITVAIGPLRRKQEVLFCVMNEIKRTKCFTERPTFGVKVVLFRTAYGVTEPFDTQEMNELTKINKYLQNWFPEDFVVLAKILHIFLVSP